MKQKVVFTVIFLILFLGAGCSSGKGNTTTSTTKVVINKKPATAEIKNPINDYCKNNGYELIIRFDKKTQASKAYCRFKNGTECEALAYYQKKCFPGKNPDVYINNSIAENSLTACSNEYKPVCGADGINYTNNCLAQIQGIKIIHDGVCTNREMTIIQQENTAENKQTEQKDSPIIISNEDDWLPILKDLILTSPSKQTPSFIEKCQISGKTYFYYSEGCSTCFNAVYGSNGQIICYPQNDLDNSCPINFNRSSRLNNCTRIWQDSR